MIIQEKDLLAMCCVCEKARVKGFRNLDGSEIWVDPKNPLYPGYVDLFNHITGTYCPECHEDWRRKSKSKK